MFARVRRLGLRYRRRSPDANDLNDALAAAGADPDLPRPMPEDPALLMPTGGTTGWPKAVLLTHRNLLANAWQVSHWCGRAVEQKVVLAVLPFFHIYGLTSCALAGVAMGATLVLHHRFRADQVLKLIERWRPTDFPAVPAMLVALNKALRRRRYDLSSIRTVVSGGAPLSPEVAAEFGRRTGATVVEGYGLSEASPVTHVGPLDGTARPGTIGLPLPDTDAMIVDPATGAGPLPPGEVGELVVRGPQVMAGYWNDPGATANALRDGWLYTGDLAACDAGRVLPHRGPEEGPHHHQRGQRLPDRRGTRVAPVRGGRGRRRSRRPRRGPRRAGQGRGGAEGRHAASTAGRSTSTPASTWRSTSARGWWRSSPARSPATRSGKLLRRVLREQHRANLGHIVGPDANPR